MEGRLPPEDCLSLVLTEGRLSPALPAPTGGFMDVSLRCSLLP